MTISWSNSMYSLATTCLSCFHKQYVEKLLQPGPESADLAFGSAMHSALNAILTGEGGEEIFEIYWNSYAGKELKCTRHKYDDLKDMGLKFCSRFARKYAERYNVEKAEIRLYGDYKGTKLEGTFDFYGSLDGKKSLLDFKTSGYNYPKEKKLTALQLYLYTYLAMQNGYEKPEQIGYCVFNKGLVTIQEPLVWNFNEATMKEMLDDMTKGCTMYERAINLYGPKVPRNPNALRHHYDCFKEEV